MTYEQFCYWLQGYFEISGENKPSSEEIKIIKEHLEKVFNKDAIVLSGFQKFPTVGDPKPLTGDYGKPFVHYSEHAVSC